MVTKGGTLSYKAGLIYDRAPLSQTVPANT
jgi:hypothetical protein